MLSSTFDPHPWRRLKAIWGILITSKSDPVIYINGELYSLSQAYLAMSTKEEDRLDKDTPIIFLNRDDLQSYTEEKNLWTQTS